MPSRDWLISLADERVSRGDPATPAGLRYPVRGKSAVPMQRQIDRGLGRRVTTADIAALRSVGELFRTLDHAYGGGHARQALVSYLVHEAEPTLRGTYGEATGRRLFAAAADLTRLAGWTTYDIAAHGLAQRYFVQALRLAQAAGDRAYGAYVLVTMSRQAVYLGHGREAVQLARVAQQGVGSGRPPAVQAMLHSAEARGHAALGEARACTASLVRAERALSAARPGNDVPHWARFATKASSPANSRPATGISTSTAPAPSTRNAPCICGHPVTPAAASSAGSCSPLPASAWENWIRRVPWGRRPRSWRWRCGPCGRWSTPGISNAALSHTATRQRPAPTTTEWPRSSDRGGSLTAHR